ncbi:hypothetical protein CRV15_31140 (plasmid) [Streptomyces clavuligerus]|uniref:Uncharacterized protein n=1 Tax=Streptomyces clavuligerus TaxID=1901 RepID=B5GTP8_STRCL|nr:hypothetical protein SSCG_02796 [Streptomyces clavuligerus]EFG04116.1 Hypothetical protein SCLAV_p0629 [Streptomyces clavuligerus]QCS10039.1 hypothetical protein CRV15_31140 [Streptomyces clavuligerus]QPJ97916.1 hypothetical protein GE265_33305 [Streptomyces clavuligerus]
MHMDGRRRWSKACSRRARPPIATAAHRDGRARGGWVRDGRARDDWARGGPRGRGVRNQPYRLFSAKGEEIMDTGTTMQGPLPLSPVGDGSAGQRLSGGPDPP